MDRVRHVEDSEKNICHVYEILISFQSTFEVLKEIFEKY